MPTMGIQVVCRGSSVVEQWSEEPRVVSSILTLGTVLVLMFNGLWRSWLARPVWDRKVVGSSPTSPTIRDMKIAVGTQNKGKVIAVENAISKYQDFAEGQIKGVPTESGVSGQPVGLEETIRGAKNRAKISFEQANADLGIGLESGIFLVPDTKSEYMDTTACAIYDGKQFHLGMSSCFEYPKLLIDKILNEGKEISDAAVELGFFEDKSEREDGGMIGLLTKGVVSRKEYSEQAVHMALIHLLNTKHY